MLSGAHIVIYSTNAEADRAFFRDALGLTSVDAGDGWLIFALPASEVAVHPAEQNDVQELYLMCEDVEAFVARMADLGIETSPVERQRWGLLTRVMLPGGGKLGVYEPRHARPGRGSVS
jgi:catechol 2,3-dioxygenase-like lactoylglutathione lyase family enzyme